MSESKSVTFKEDSKVSQESKESQDSKKNSDKKDKTIVKGNRKGAELRDMENEIQENVWKKHDAFVVKPRVGEKNINTYFGTFPYPYMNGFLHLGHGFTLSKLDFICKFYRMIGYDVLQPFSFHLTGMPIMAAADKIKYELTETVTSTPQTDIMKKMGIPDELIPKFADPRFWGEYFPKAAVKTLRRFGISYDHTRSFITTDKSPYYDRFVKWQFSKLHEKKALKFGTRFDLFSIKENQACLGSERSSGEDAKPVAGCLICFELAETDVFCEVHDLDPENPIVCPAFTVRPETMYGVTNLWVDPKGEYSVYLVNHQGQASYFICQEHNILNLQYQLDAEDITSGMSDFKNAKFICTISGSDLIDEKVINIHGIIDTVPIMAMNFKNRNSHLRIDMERGTGIVASVPSDSPIDYLAYLYATDIESVDDIIISIIEVDHKEYSGNRVAADMIYAVHTKNKAGDIRVSNDDMQKIKEFCYQRSVASSKMLVGEFKGSTVSEARDNIKATWVKDSYVIPYYEPDKVAYSRSGEKLIVAKMEQWYIDYGDEQWKKDAHHHLDQMQFNDPQVYKMIDLALDWLDQWPCSRTYGLGSRFPEHVAEPEHMIDSLSDSTIYMALYTIYHLFEKLGIKPDELTDEVFDYIFLLENYDDPKLAKFKPLREEFIHWYPMDVRVSAKDLVNNHLAMSIFNHVMIWDQKFKDNLKIHYPGKNPNFGPKTYEINGYIAIKKKNEKQKEEIEKMSKSKGNFKTLDQAIDFYTTDSVRFTFASASIGTDDAFFDQDLCNRMVERIYSEKDWITCTLEELERKVYTRETITFVDKVFMNEISILIKNCVRAYKDFRFHEAVLYGFHLMQQVRDNYRSLCGHDYNPELLKLWIRTQIHLIYPIMPHFAEYFNTLDVYNRVMVDSHSKGESIWTRFELKEDYVDSLEVDDHLHWAHGYLSNIASDISKRSTHLMKKQEVKKITIYVAGEVTDPLEEMALRVYTPGVEMENKEIIRELTKLEPEKMKDRRMVGQVIRAYHKVKDNVKTYGEFWYEYAKQSKFNEHEIFDKHLRTYLVNTNAEKLELEIVNHTKESDPVAGVRTNDPVIQYS